MHGMRTGRVPPEQRHIRYFRCGRSDITMPKLASKVTADVPP